MILFLQFFGAVYYIVVLVGLLDGNYRSKSTFLYDLIPFAGLFRIIIKHYSKLD